jgi:anthranilate phosphoribosyltransferase
MRHAAVARSELGIRTILNVLGPLSNPARATHQLLGAYADSLRPIMAECLRELGVTRAWVVWGEDGLDEMSPSGPTRVADLAANRIVERVVTPEDFGLPRVPAEALRGGDASHNAAVLRGILAGEPHPARPGIILNAAAALVVALDLPLQEAARRAEEAIASGRALSTLERWKEIATLAKGA